MQVKLEIVNAFSQLMCDRRSQNRTQATALGNSPLKTELHAYVSHLKIELIVAVMNRLMRLECTFSAQRVCPKLAAKSPSLNIWTSLDSIADY